MNKKTRMIAISIILVLTISFVAFQLMNTFGNVYTSVDTVNANPEAHMGRALQVKGTYQAGSLASTADNVTLVIEGNTTTLLVVLLCETPDVIDGQEIVAIGTLISATVLQATDILVQCPSKYEATTTAP